MKKKVRIPKGQLIQESLYNASGRLVQIITSDEMRRSWFLYDIEGDKLLKAETGDSPKFAKRKV